MRVNWNHSIIRQLIILTTVLFSICFVSCEKIDYLKKPAVQTVKVDNSTAYTVQATGEITDYGDTKMLEYGFCWSTSNNPTKLNSVIKLDLNSIQGVFNYTITGLQSDQTYYLRAFATNETGTAYGDETSFTTNDGNILITTTEASNITPTSAQSGGSINDDGGSPVTARGVCWNTTGNPVITDSIKAEGSGTGSFICNLSGLDVGTKYYVRSYATNEIGTSYGNEEIFTTLTTPSLTTIAISAITVNSVQSGGNITDDGGTEVFDRGVCYDTSPNPDINDNTVHDDNNGIGTFNCTINGLMSGTSYYVRAFATNSVGTSYGNELIFETMDGAIIDIDGNEYFTVIIGAQEWMAENLKTTHYADGTELVDGTGAGDISGDYTTKYYFNYADDESNADTYGKLYTWAAVMNGAASSDVIQSGVQGVCPDGWHMPSDSAWKELEIHLGMSQSDADDIGNRGTDEGEKLKEIGTTHWVSNNNATNESGFTALPGGSRYDNGSFNGIGYNAYFWSTTENSTYNAWYRKLGFDYSSIIRYANEKESGHSVRCIKD